jgi:hypothetical protein
MPGELGEIRIWQPTPVASCLGSSDARNRGGVKLGACQQGVIAFRLREVSR